MATHKQKRARVLAKRQEFEAAERKRNLELQRASQQARLKRRQDAARPKHEEDHSWRKRDLDCILCVEEIKAAEKAALEMTQQVVDAEEGVA